MVKKVTIIAYSFLDWYRQTIPFLRFKTACTQDPQIIQKSRQERTSAKKNRILMVILLENNYTFYHTDSTCLSTPPVSEEGVDERPPRMSMMVHELSAGSLQNNRSINPTFFI